MEFVPLQTMDNIAIKVYTMLGDAKTKHNIYDYAFLLKQLLLLMEYIRHCQWIYIRL